MFLHPSRVFLSVKTKEHKKMCLILSRIKNYDIRFDPLVVVIYRSLNHQIYAQSVDFKVSAQKSSIYERDLLIKGGGGGSEANFF